MGVHLGRRDNGTPERAVRGVDASLQKPVGEVRQRLSKLVAEVARARPQGRHNGNNRGLKAGDIRLVEDSQQGVAISTIREGQEVGPSDPDQVVVPGREFDSGVLGVLL